MAAFIKLTSQELNTYEFINVDFVVRVQRDPSAPDQRTKLVFRKDIGLDDLVVLEDLATVIQKMGL